MIFGNLREIVAARGGDLELIDACYPRKPMIETATRIRRLVVVLVEVTKYDREGYLIQFHKGVLPCNTLAAMWSLTEAAFASSELAGLLCRVIAFDERTMRGGVNSLQVMKKLSVPDTRVVVGLVGVQTNMFPRARQLALEFKTGY
jgi:hypothetical protein